MKLVVKQSRMDVLVECLMKLFVRISDQTGSYQSFKPSERLHEENDCINEDLISDVIKRQFEKDTDDWIHDRGIYARPNRGSNMQQIAFM